MSLLPYNFEVAKNRKERKEKHKRQAREALTRTKPYQEMMEKRRPKNKNW